MQLPSSWNRPFYLGIGSCQIVADCFLDQCDWGLIPLFPIPYYSLFPSPSTLAMIVAIMSKIVKMYQIPSAKKKKCNYLHLCCKRK